LARWQAEHIAARLSREQRIESELLIITTSGDRFVDRPLAEVGGKGLFVKEIEEALLSEEADLAVHSAKDLPGVLPEGLSLVAFPERADPRDALISNHPGKLSDLPRAAKVATGSERRRCQLLAARPDLDLLPLRGNVDTRLRKLREEGLDAVVLACAGLDRLGRGDEISERISVETMLPAAGQGSLALEARDSGEAREVARLLTHPDSETRLLAERAFLATLGGDCHVPVAAFAELDGSTLRLRCLLGNPAATEILRIEEVGERDRAEEVGRRAGRGLLEAGGAKILSDLSAGFRETPPSPGEA